MHGPQRRRLDKTADPPVDGVMNRLTAAALPLVLAACATVPASDDLATYPAALVGAYDNAAQYAEAPDDLKRPPTADAAQDWLDRQAVTFATVSAPALGPAVVYAEWRGADGAVSHQRLWSFRRDTDGVRIDLYGLKDSAHRAGAGDAAVFAALTANDLTGYGPTCALAVTSSGHGAWNAQTDTETCRATSRDGREMSVDARVTVMPTGVLYQEVGRDADGGYVFRLPGGPPYDFRRRP